MGWLPWRHLIRSKIHLTTLSFFHSFIFSFVYVSGPDLFLLFRLIVLFALFFFPSLCNFYEPCRPPPLSSWTVCLVKNSINHVMGRSCRPFARPLPPPLQSLVADFAMIEASVHGRETSTSKLNFEHPPHISTARHCCCRIIITIYIYTYTSIGC